MHTPPERFSPEDPCLYEACVARRVATGCAVMLRLTNDATISSVLLPALELAKKRPLANASVCGDLLLENFHGRFYIHKAVLWFANPLS